MQSRTAKSYAIQEIWGNVVAVATTTLSTDSGVSAAPASLLHVLDTWLPALLANRITAGHQGRGERG